MSPAWRRRKGLDIGRRGTQKSSTPAASTLARKAHARQHVLGRATTGAAEKGLGWQPRRGWRGDQPCLSSGRLGLRPGLPQTGVMAIGFAIWPACVSLKPPSEVAGSTVPGTVTVRTASYHEVGGKKFAEKGKPFSCPITRTGGEQTSRSLCQPCVTLSLCSLSVHARTGRLYT